MWVSKVFFFEEIIIIFNTEEMWAKTEALRLVPYRYGLLGSSIYRPLFRMWKVYSLGLNPAHIELSIRRSAQLGSAFKSLFSRIYLEFKFIVIFFFCLSFFFLFLLLFTYLFIPFFRFPLFFYLDNPQYFIEIES